MEKLLIKGGASLKGEISCSGAKNAALPMIAATILSDEDIILKNLPYLQDITTMFELLGSMGADILLNENMDFTIATNNLKEKEARYELVKTMVPTVERSIPRAFVLFRQSGRDGLKLIEPRNDNRITATGIEPCTVWSNHVDVAID